MDKSQDNAAVEDVNCSLPVASLSMDAPRQPENATSVHAKRVPLPADYTAALTTGKVVRLPLPTWYPASVRRAIHGFRRSWECVLVARDGKVDEWSAKKLRTAAKALAQAMYCDRQLAEGDLDHDQRMAYLDRAARFEAEADRALTAMGLDKSRDADPWAAFYAAKPQLPLPTTAPITKPTSPTPASAEVAPEASVGVLDSHDLADK